MTAKPAALILRAFAEPVRALDCEAEADAVTAPASEEDPAAVEVMVVVPDALVMRVLLPAEVVGYGAVVLATTGAEVELYTTVGTVVLATGTTVGVVDSGTGTTALVSTAEEVSGTGTYAVGVSALVSTALVSTALVTGA